MSIKIKFKLDGKNRTFTQQTINARKMRKLFKFYSDMSKVENGETTKSELDVLDDMLILVENFFDDKDVNFDNLLDGLDATELMPTLQDVFEQVSRLGQDEKKIQAVKPV
nr:MAG TPA: hypothetical protein [Caudoviricetes sp.]